MESAVIYARFSSHGQNEQSIEAQVRICKEFAESKELKIINIYTDKARTGTNDARPGFQRMISDAKSGAFRYIIVYMFDRFARNRHDSIVYKEMLREKFNVRVISALEPIAEDEGGEFYEMFLEWNAEKYSKRLSKRVRDGLDTSVANGTFCGGHLIYGYKIDLEPIPGKSGKFVKRVVIDEDEAEILRYAFERYDAGVSKKEIAEALNAKGLRFNGKPFKGRTFDRYFVNEKYTGEFYFGDRLCTNMYPQIIDKALFERVKAKLTANKYYAGGEAQAKVPHLLTGKLICGYCKTLMRSDKGTGKMGKAYYYYICRNVKSGKCNKQRMDKDPLEEYVTRSVVKFLSDKNNAVDIARDTVAFYDKRTDEQSIKAIQTRIVNIRKEVEDLTTAYVKARNDLLRDTIEKQMEEYEILLNDLLEQEAKLELERGYKLTEQDILNFINMLIIGDTSDKDFQKSIIDNLVKWVYVYDDHKIIVLNINSDKSVEDLTDEQKDDIINELGGDYAADSGKEFVSAHRLPAKTAIYCVYGGFLCPNSTSVIDKKCAEYSRLKHKSVLCHKCVAAFTLVILVLFLYAAVLSVHKKSP